MHPIILPLDECVNGFFNYSGFRVQGGKGLASEAEIRDEEPVEILRAYGFKHTENPC
jgi:hypothetical protein